MFQKKIKLLLAALVFSAAAFSQNNFSFSCARDTIIPGCGVSCITLKAKLPDIRTSSASYSVNNVNAGTGCFTPIVPPNDAGGTSADLTIDDRYSSVIDIGFPFNFFGTTYTQLIASANGVISFDISKANGLAHYNIINAGNPQNLPSTFYDRAIIMGPYHDLDPSENTSPDKKIQYQTFGNAPHRRWVFSFYKVPLYSAACDRLIENTHQMVLYESTGIIEIYVFSKQVCTTWNQGRAMIGMQDFDRINSIMAPGRQASDAPWGTVNMNEVWRFTPSTGPSLFKRTELYTMGGVLVANGTVVPAADGTLEASFANVCPAGSSQSYVIKSFYQKNDDPAAEVFALDTVTVTRNVLFAEASSTPSSCTPSGTITTMVLPGTGVPPFTYKLDAGTPQSSNIFTGVSAGLHSVLVTDALGCTTTISVTVGSSATVAAAATTIAALCNGSSTGVINATGSGGAPPYQFNINGGAYQTSGTFNGLAPNSYVITVKDAGGCISNPVTVIVGQPTAIVVNATTQPAKCNGAADGVITISGSGGTPPYLYSINGTLYGSSGTFTVAAGPYIAYIKDANGCLKQQAVTVSEPAAITSSAATTNASCNGGTDGTITTTAGGGTAPYQYSINGGTAYQTSNLFNVAPGAYTITIKDANGCIKTQTATVGLTNDLTYTSMSPDTLCEGTSIVLQPVSNATSYTWSGTPLTLNNASGSSVTVSPTASTQYTFVGNFGRCTYNDTVNIFVNKAPVPDAGSDGAICYGQDYRLAAAPGMVSYEWLPATYLAGNITGFNPDVIRPGSTITYTLQLVDSNGCRSLVTDAVTVNVTPPIIVTTNPTDTIVYIGDVIGVTAFSAGTNYIWTPAYGLSDPASKSPMISVDKDITYTIEATTAAGCRGDTTLTIKAFKGPEIYVPTAFTPNKDGHNDLLRPFPVGIKTLNYFRVFNRWGNMVYSWAGIDRGPVVFNMFSSGIGWDGTQAGKPLTTGTYVWVAEGITKDGKLIQRKGVCSLIR